MPTRKTDPTATLHDPLTPSERQARTLTQRLQAALDAAHLKPQDDSWLSTWHFWARALAQSSWPEGDQQEREGLEQRAAQGDIEALAGLIRLDLDYLKTPQIVLAIRVLRSRAVLARTPEEQQEAKTGLEAIANALLPDLRGLKCPPSPTDAARVYREMLKAYKAAKRGEEPPKVPLPRGYWPDTGPCPRHVTPAGPYTRLPGKINLLPSPHFTIPPEDIPLLKSKRSGCTPSALALTRMGEIFGLSKDRIQKHIAAGRKEER